MTTSQNSVTRPVLNVPLLEATMARILAEPESWDQTFVAMPTACGTTFCFAGHAALLYGCTYSERHYFRRDGVSVDPVYVAQNALGLTDDDAAELFFGTFTKDPDVLHRKVKALIESRGGAS